MLLFCCPTIGFAQFLPRENSALHYTKALFTTLPKAGATDYQFEVAKGVWNIEDSFKRYRILTASSTSSTIICDLPEFGASYTWRVSFGKSEKTEFHHFSTLKSPFVDTTLYRLRILKQATTYKDAYVFLDGTRTLYDLKGKPIWFLPDLGGIISETAIVRDLKTTSRGTITFLLGEISSQQLFEINYDGVVLWKGPNTGEVSGDTSEFYHHEFTRLDNGNYLALGSEFVDVHQKTSATGFSRPANTVREGAQAVNNPSLSRTQFGTVIEYDASGKVVWSWKSSAYFLSGNFQFEKTEGRPMRYNTHENSFYFDSKDSLLYLSFKNISHVVVVKYPQGEVVQDYGKSVVPFGSKSMHNTGFNIDFGNGLFCGQHSCKISGKGNLYMVNNNSCDTSARSEAVMFRKTGNNATGLERIWRYTESPDPTMPKVFSIGGSIIELKDESMFVLLNKIAIVSKSEKALWNAVAEKWNADLQKWDNALQYRASIIPTVSDFERLIKFK